MAEENELPEPDEIPLTGDTPISDSEPVREPETQSNPLRDALAGHNIEIDPEWDDQRILSEWGQVSERAEAAPDPEELTRLQQYAKYGEQFVPHLTEIEKFLAGQKEPVEEPKAEEKPIWDPPGIDDTDTAFIQAGLKSGGITEDSSGSLVASDARFAEPVRKYNEREAYLGGQIQSFRDNPYDFVWNGIEGRVSEREKKLLERIEALEAGDQERNKAGFFDSVGDKYGTTGEDGKFAMNSAGQAFQKIFQSLPDSIPEYQRLQQAADLVDEMSGLFTPQEQAETKETKKTPREKNADQKKLFLERQSLNGAGSHPNRSSKVPQADDHDDVGSVPDKPRRFLDMAIEEAKNQGVELS